MSQDNLELIRRGFETFARCDLKRFLEFTDPDIEIIEPIELPGPRTYHDHQGLLDSLRPGPENGRTSEPSRSASRVTALEQGGIRSSCVRWRVRLAS
jgi:ketosteroid isomerase-like protein